MNKRIVLSIFVICLALFVEAQKPLILFGGQDHDVFLGCLNCDNYASNSIWNAYNSYGSKYNSNSIWNAYGTYGSEYSTYSPFNENASYPPVIVDKEGGFYGYFTINTSHDKRADLNLAMTIYKYYDMIRDDVPAWYDKIFK